MTNMDQIVKRLRAIWKFSADRVLLPCAFSLICIIGSYLKEQDLVPKSYFSDTKNVLNLYFVKVSLGWTLFLLVPFVILSSSLKSPSVFVLRRLCALVVATAVWYICVNTFDLIEEATGSCYETSTKEVIHGELTSKGICRKKGFVWDGYDISGHSFILSYSALVISEEMASMVEDAPGFRKPLLNGLYLSMSIIVYLWLFMFASTSVYFHSPMDKCVGTGCGLLGWYLTYRVWYRNPLSPGLPSKRQVKHHA
ncbi:acyl-coenzyme A diphosphatase FITM2 [Alosa pseudoharengus]|uniref:acyl-coenzyme A diphosphatase FITM2 n=1 Tax=Alosa pseudoharengus TaxID=34774 RepID=UPI003F88AB2B